MRLIYRMSAAEFAVELGEQIELLDENGDPFAPQLFGRAAALPLTSRIFKVYTSPSAVDETTDLQDMDEQSISQLETSTDFATLAQPQNFRGPDEHRGALYLSGDEGETFFKIEPVSDPVWDEVETLRESVSGHDDWSDTAPLDGQAPIWDDGTGQWVPGDVEAVDALKEGDQIDLPTGDDRLLLVRIDDDGTATAGWTDRLAFAFEVGGQGSGNYQLTGWFNEFGEFRAQSSSNSRVAMRAHGHSASQTADIFQVRLLRNDPSTDVLRVSPNAVTARKPFIVDGPYLVINGIRLYLADANPGPAPEGSVWIDTSEQEA